MMRRYCVWAFRAIQTTNQVLDTLDPRGLGDVTRLQKTFWTVDALPRDVGCGAALSAVFCSPGNYSQCGEQQQSIDLDSRNVASSLRVVDLSLLFLQSRLHASSAFFWATVAPEIMRSSAVCQV